MVPSESTMEPGSLKGGMNCSCPDGAENCTLMVACNNESLDETSFRKELLQRLNDEKAIHFIPVTILMVVLLVIGVIGNTLVVYIYRRRFKKTSSNYFILTMAIFDLVACVVGMPTEIYDLRYSYTFYSSVGCKIFRFTETFTIYGSAIVLVEIAFDRYFKICRPLLVISLFKIKMLCFIASILALVLSTPTALLFGITRMETPVPGILGYDCSIEEQYRKSKFQKIYYIILMIIFFSTLGILTGLYIRIWIEIRRRSKMVIGDQLTKPKEEEHDRKKMAVRVLPSVSDGDSSNAKTNTILMTSPSVSSAKRTRFNSLANYASKLRFSRTTVVLFAVTVAFVISYLPAIVIMLCRSIIPDLEKNQTLAEEVTSKFFSKFTFINNAINPIIYSFLNINFRRQARKTIKRVFCCQRRRPPAKVDSDRSTKKEFILS